MTNKAFKCLREAGPSKPATANSPATGPTYTASYVDDVVNDTELGVKNLRELFEKSVEEQADRPCLGWRPVADGKPGPYQFLTYRETADLAAAVHAGYVSLGLKPMAHVGVIGANSPEWMLSLQGLNRMNGVCVPLYDTLGDAAVEYIVEHAEIKLIMVQAVKLPVIAGLLSKGAKAIVTSGVVYWGTPKPEAVKSFKDAGVSCLSWEEFIAKGKAAAVPPESPAPTDICTIMYTSGTTGNPKGVVISHKAMLHTIGGLGGLLEEVNEHMGPTDVYLSYLTMAHIFDRVVEEFMLHIGGSIGYWQGDPRKIMEDVGVLKPTLFAGVPRVYERVYNAVQDKMKKASALAKWVYNYAYNRKKYFMSYNWRFDRASMLSDVLVFNKIKNQLGGKVRIMVTGGAPIPEHVEEFLKVAMCAPIVQGYGLTETCAASFISYPFDWDQTATVGPPMPQTKLRLEAVPEMGYDPTGNPPRGEVCIGGPGIFSGYYKDEAMTKETLDADGFFHTGDIGEITPTGALKLIDRKKNLFKLSHGEYIAVERVENVYKASPLVEQIWIYGNSFESSLVAVVVPQEKPLRSLAAEVGIEGADSTPLQQLVNDSKVKAAVLKKMQATGRENKLKGFEEIKAIKLEEEHFSVENDLMTPSFKLKRQPLLKKYQKEITAMYNQLKAAGNAS